MTREQGGVKGEESMIFADEHEVARAYQSKQADIHARVKVRLKEYALDKEGILQEIISLKDTTVGRVLLYGKLVPKRLSRLAFD